MPLPMIETATLPENAPKTRARRFTEADVKFVADHVGRGLSESGAVVLLEKKPDLWFNWKNRGKRTAKINELLARARESRLANLTKQIEIAGDVDLSAKNKVRFDWKAAQMLASLHDDRFRNTPTQSSVTTNNTQITVALGGDAGLARLVAQYAAAALSQPKDISNADSENDKQNLKLIETAKE